MTWMFVCLFFLENPPSYSLNPNQIPLTFTKAFAKSLHSCRVWKDWTDVSNQEPDLTENLQRCLNLSSSFRHKSDLPERLYKQGHGEGGELIFGENLPPPTTNIFPPSRWVLTATVFSTPCGSPLQYYALPLPLLDGWGAQDRPDGFVEHCLKAALRQSWALQILHCTWWAEERKKGRETSQQTSFFFVCTMMSWWCHQGCLSLSFKVFF